MPITDSTPDAGAVPEMKVRIKYVGETQHALAEAERAVLTPGLGRPEPHIIRALTLLANRAEREHENGDH